MNGDKSNAKTYRGLGLAISYVAETLTLTLVGYFFGDWLDKKLTTGNGLYSVTLMLTGLTIGFIKLYRSLIKNNKNE